VDLREAAAPPRPAILVTGASGLVGRAFIAAVRERFCVYAVARRGQRDAGVEPHENVRWLRCDLGDGPAVARLAATVAEESRIDFVFHFAGYYDFEHRECPEYRRTNVDGTRHLLEAAARLRPRRFVYASSLAVSDFADPRRILDEDAPADGDSPYARSKRAAEELVVAASARFPCAIARLAAVYSDWCEYAPLYVLLNSWLGGGLRSRVIAGRGETALPYLHVSDLTDFWLRVVDAHERLGDLVTLVASPGQSVSHNELYLLASQGYGEGARPLRVPVGLAAVGLAGLRLAGRLAGRPPFERFWMLRYVDRRMRVDPRRSERLLGWRIRPRHHLMRRLPFLVDNLRSDPQTWERRNLAMTKQAVEERPGLRVYNAMVELREQVVAAHVAYLAAESPRGLYPNYRRLDPGELRLRSELLYQMLESSFRLGDHRGLLGYASHLARRRHREGIPAAELSGSIEHIADTLEGALLAHPGLAGLGRRIHLDMGLTVQLILDGIEEEYERLAGAGAAGLQSLPPRK